MIFKETVSGADHSFRLTWFDDRMNDYPPDMDGNNTRVSPSATNASRLDLRPLIRDTWWPLGIDSILCMSKRVAPGSRFSVKWA